uniref:Reverse transcriptase Ty1/copia-type domain-containing protein n=1 Tax=Solanum lycopersicum TaxID=4081 RepID=A0A3Q7FKT2_SOLLC
MKDIFPLHLFLGIEVKYFQSGIHLDQRKDDFGKGCNSLAQNMVCMKLWEVLIIVGSLQYLTFTRADITIVVNLASHFIQSPNIEHLQGIKRILRYIKDILHFGLKIISKSLCWGGCTTSWILTTCYNIYLGANCICWTSKKQTTIARSSAEVEHRELTSTAAEMT